MAPSDDTADAATAPPTLVPGTTFLQGLVIAGRFTIEELAGRGGMGFVYRARDSRTGQRVALKLLHTLSSADALYRFKREALLLSELRHPAIVSYIDHGFAEGDQPFIAMEWLEGEDLSRRLSRQPLSLTETLTLMRRAAEALRVAHERGIVHRDLKPSNLFLRGGRAEDVVLFDFGLARYVAPTLVGVTNQGTVLGTPGYMAPEQAAGHPVIAPSADIFSLGCVLQECLTGQAPFAAPHFAAVLAKILMAEPPRLHTLRPGLPPGLQGLVDRMLDKEPGRRLPDATLLLESLAALELRPELLASAVAPAPPPLGTSGEPSQVVSIEQQLVSILLVPPRSPVAGGLEDAAQRPIQRDVLRTLLAPYGGRVELLVDGSLVATLVPERGTATDQAALAARCALMFKERWPEAEVVLVTGLGVLRKRLPVGEAMDRVGRLLRELEQPRAAEALIVLDEVTAGLLGPGFLLSRSPAGFYLLQGEQLGADESRTLMGKPTPCVGRVQELALLEFTFTSCVEEPACHALLVVAPPGMGKSRLRHEFLRRLERKAPQALVLQARGDPMSAGVTSNLLGQALRRLCGIVEAAPLEERRARLSQRVARHLPSAEARETVEFLGELCAIAFPDESSPRLRAARQDPRLMSAQMSKALVGFLRAECAQAPVVLVLDDLHWSDALSVKVVEEALRELRDHAFMVLALARPDVKELFPGLWAWRVLEVALHGLRPKASAQLVREVLGPRATDSVVQRVVEQSDGNALFLEELIRGEVEGRGETPPETVVAVLQARLMSMAPETRRVLLAASVFGRAFWPRGLQELLGDRRADSQMEEHLRWLMGQEVIEPQPDSRFPTETEYRFRHSLLVDAAYGLVPEVQRPLAHRRVGMWLEGMGESDAQMLARHFQLGQRLDRAAHFHSQAAELLFARGDQRGATRSVEAALACGVGGEALTRLRALQSLVAVWMEQMPRALELGNPVLSELEVGSRMWCWLMGGLMVANAMNGHQPEVERLSAMLLRTTPEPEAVAAYVEALSLLGATSFWKGERREQDAMLERILDVGGPLLAQDGLVRGYMRLLKGELLNYFEAKPWQSYMLLTLGMRDFRELGVERVAAMMQLISGTLLIRLGQHAEAVESFREVLAEAVLSEQHLVGHAGPFLLQALVLSADPEHRREARTLVQEWMDNEELPPFRRALEHASMAQALAAQGELPRAEVYARRACELLAPFLVFRVHARAVLSSILLARGRAVEAREVAHLGVQDLERMGSRGIYAVVVYLALAESCFALDDGEVGEAALRQAVQCVHEGAADIPEAPARERFLRQVPENARALELARQRWGHVGLD